MNSLVVTSNTHTHTHHYTHYHTIQIPHKLNVYTFSSRMCFMSHNWSATKQRLHLQSVAPISRHSVLSGDRIRQCETSSGSRHKDTRTTVNSFQYSTPLWQTYWQTDTTLCIASHHKSKWAWNLISRLPVYLVFPNCQNTMIVTILQNLFQVCQLLYQPSQCHLSSIHIHKTI